MRSTTSLGHLADSFIRISMSNRAILQVLFTTAVSFLSTAVRNCRDPIMYGPCGIQHTNVHVRRQQRREQEKEDFNSMPTGVHVCAWEFGGEGGKEGERKKRRESE